MRQHFYPSGAQAVVVQHASYYIHGASAEECYQNASARRHSRSAGGGRRSGLDGAIQNRLRGYMFIYREKGWMEAREREVTEERER